MGKSSVLGQCPLSWVLQSQHARGHAWPPVSESVVTAPDKDAPLVTPACLCLAPALRWELALAAGQRQACWSRSP